MGVRYNWFEDVKKTVTYHLYFRIHEEQMIFKPPLKTK